MLDFISNCKQKIIIYKKQLLSLALIPVFMFRSSLSGFAAEVSPDSKNEWFLLPFNEFRNVSGVFSESSGTYNATGYTGSVDGWGNSFTCSDVGGVFPTFKAGHKYLIYLTLTASTSNSDISVNSFGLRLSGESSIVVWPENISRTLNYFDSTFTLVQLSQYSPSVDRVLSTSSVMSLELISTANYTNRLSWGIYALDITENSQSEVNQIVTAINNQTTNIMNAGSGFGGTTSGILSGNDQLSGFIDDYTEIEQSMYDKFTENQSAVIGNFSGFSWGSLSTAVDWTSDYLNRIYDNSGDFRTMFMYPILAGIALIFIGRQGLTAYVRSRREK